MRDLGVGLVSVGWMGRLHARAYRALPDHFPELALRPRLVVAADPVEGNRRAATEELGFERAVEDYREVLADPAVDVVSICSPNFLHREIALAAVSAGKPFWIEKPMGVDAAQSREVARAAEDAGLMTAVGFNYRQEPAVQHLRELVRSGRLGRVTNVRVWLIADYASSPRGALTWRYDRARAGAGVVSDLMSHGADLAQYLFGRIGEVTAMTGTFIAERPVPLTTGVGHAAIELSDETGPVDNEDYVAALVRFDDGVLGTLEASRVAVGPRAEYAVQVFGTEGSARWDFTRPNQFKVLIPSESGHHGYTTVMTDGTHGEYGRFQPGPGQSMSFDDLKTIECALFLRSVITGEQLAPSAADAWSAAEFDEAAVASAADGRWHAVPAVDGRTTTG